MANKGPRNGMKDGQRTPTKETDFSVAHITFRVREYKDGQETFALYAGDANQIDNRVRPLFTGFVEAGMAAQLRDLAKKVDQLAAKRSMNTL
jgi:hypothetical protein